MKKILTLAIPTNGAVDWVIPVLNSIYEQSVAEDLFEVVVTDNGEGDSLSKKIRAMLARHNNLVYKKTNAQLFMNQIEAFKLATGEYIKFVNHRTPLKEGTLNFLIDFARENVKEKPITYFLNGAYSPQHKNYKYSDFDTFAYELSYFSSWSGGIGCWKSDLKEILSNVKKQTLFPHLAFVYIDIPGRKYCIKENRIFDELPFDPQKKGNYDVFYAFGCEYVDLILDLYKKKSIEEDTKNHILNENEEFIISLYATYSILKKTCSYDLSSSRKSLNYYYSYKKIKIKSIVRVIKKAIKRIMHR